MKKIRINLYSAEFKPKKIILSLPQMLLIWAVLGCVMVSLAYYSHVKKVQLEQQAESLTTELDDKKMEFDALKAKVSAQVLDKSLERELNELKVLEETKSTLIEIMQKKNVLKSHGYAGFMADLATIATPGISLSQINLMEKSADLYGVASNSYLVPKWVSSFSKTADLSSFSFGGIKLAIDKDSGLINFSLTRENKSVEPNVQDSETPNLVDGRAEQEVTNENR